MPNSAILVSGNQKIIKQYKTVTNSDKLDSGIQKMKKGCKTVPNSAILETAGSKNQTSGLCIFYVLSIIFI